jgi:hypothetical protein
VINKPQKLVGIDPKLVVAQKEKILTTNEKLQRHCSMWSAKFQANFFLKDCGVTFFSIAPLSGS